MIDKTNEVYIVKQRLIRKIQQEGSNIYEKE